MPRRSSRPSFAMQKAVCSHPELRLMGKPTWCFSFTSDVFDIYHVNDFMKTRGWRFNGQQYPERHPHVRDPAADAARRRRHVRARISTTAVRYALNPPRDMPASGAVYGGAPKGIPEVQQDDQRLHGRLPRRLAGRAARARLGH